VVGNSAGVSLTSLLVPLDATMPRAVPIDVDLQAVPDTHFVMFLAIAGSNVDGLTASPVLVPPPAATPPTVVDLVQRWPYAALRVVRIAPRPH
jgi:hypothetical protein